MRVSGSSQEFAEQRVQRGITAAEIIGDRDQKAESAEKEGCKKFRLHEIKHDSFVLMVRPAALPAR